jgi:hypothetical protein
MMMMMMMIMSKNMNVTTLNHRHILANNTGGAKSTMDTRNLIYEGVKLQ